MYVAATVARTSLLPLNFHDKLRRQCCEHVLTQNLVERPGGTGN